MLLMNVKPRELFLFKGTVYKLIQFVPGKAKTKIHMMIRAKKWHHYKDGAEIDMTLDTVVQKVRVDIEILKES